MQHAQSQDATRGADNRHPSFGTPDVIGIFLLNGADDMLMYLTLRAADHLRNVVLPEIASLDGGVGETTSPIFEQRRKTVVPSL